MRTVDLFDASNGLVNGHTLTIERDALGFTLTTSTGLVGRLVAAERSTQFWYLVILKAAGFTALVHFNDWRG